jgi:hypothetical protein
MTVSVTGGGASLTTGTPTVLFPFRPAAAKLFRTVWRWDVLRGDGDTERYEIDGIGH